MITLLVCAQFEEVTAQLERERAQVGSERRKMKADLDEVLERQEGRVAEWEKRMAKAEAEMQSRETVVKVGATSMLCVARRRPMYVTCRHRSRSSGSSASPPKALCWHALYIRT